MCLCDRFPQRWQIEGCVAKTVFAWTTRVNGSLAIRSKRSIADAKSPTRRCGCAWDRHEQAHMEPRATGAQRIGRTIDSSSRTHFGDWSETTGRLELWYSLPSVRSIRRQFHAAGRLVDARNLIGRQEGSSDALRARLDGDVGQIDMWRSFPKSHGLLPEP